MLALERSTPSVADVDRAVQAPSMGAAVWTITPKVAQHILDQYHEQNRDRRLGWQRELSEAMRRGTWRMTGDSIKFGHDTELKDGQHRMNACVMSRTPFETVVITGVPNQSFDAMDTGNSRNASDIFKLAGVPYANVVSGATNWLCRLTDGKPLSDRATRTPQVLLAAHKENWPALPLSASNTAVRAVAKNKRQPHALMTALHCLFQQSNPSAADRFFDDWGNDRNSTGKKRHPTETLNSEFARRTSALAEAGGRMDDRDRVLLVVLAWNAFVSNRALNAKDLSETYCKRGDVTWPGIS